MSPNKHIEIKNELNSVKKTKINFKVLIPITKKSCLLRPNPEISCHVSEKSKNIKKSNCLQITKKQETLQIINLSKKKETTIKDKKNAKTSN